MKQGSRISLPIYLILGLLLVFTPFTNLYAQDEEDDSVEEIFWGDEEEDEGLDEEFDFSEDEDLGDEDLEGFEFEDEGFEDEFSEDEFADDEGEDFSEDFADEPQETIQETATRLGYTLNIIGSSPSFVNHQLRTYNSGVDFRAAFEFPMLLQMGPVRFRLGAEVGTFNFTNYKPIGGTFSGVHVTGILSFPAGPGLVRLGGGMVGKGFGIIAENSYGFGVGDALDIRFGLRSTTAFNVTDDKNNQLGTVSWLDG
ncbi:MAG: hypothetical protein QF842_01550, partial [Candidatus Marinimicrobia bacterium]|nr:hypothetical protein [Candidatus Neomarinimicrobiota bacterium]